MDPTGNTLGATGQTALTVTNNVPGANGFSQAKTQDFNMTITMPTNMACTGGSTGNICTIRCRNNALAGPFGGCIAVQQAGAAAKTNVASKISSAATKSEVDAQVKQDKQDLAGAIAANQDFGSNQQVQAQAAVKAAIGPSIVSKQAAVQTPAVAATNSGNAKANGKAGKGNANAAAAKAGTGN